METFCRETAVAVSTVDTLLKFKPVTLADLPLINGLLQTGISRTCDYSVGGIFMWIDYFSYEYCVVDDTLFLKGRTENCRVETSFMVPVGAMPLPRAIELILDYCQAKNLRPVFSAVPEDRLEALTDVLGEAVQIEPLDDWSDYLYRIDALATLSGKHLAKKRNHLNRFKAENPNYIFEPLDYRLLPEVELFMAGTDEPDSPMAAYERQECRRVLNHYTSFPFEGAVLRGEAGDIEAFAIGEVIADTLYVHIEKIRHDASGAGAAICSLFAAYMLHRHPSLRYVNREEDCGDEGLRTAKEQYHPVALLHKYNVRM